MKLLSYFDYLSESNISELILESKLVYSKKFINILNRMKSNKIAGELLKIYTKDIDGIQQNYIDVSDRKDNLIFTPDRKAQELNAGRPETWKVINSGRYLTHNSTNNRIYDALGYTMETESPWAPDVGKIGLILNETVSRTSGRTYVIFEEYGVDNPRRTVLNKEAVEPSDADNQQIWTTSRSPIKVGRLVRAILSAAKIEFTDREIEEFTNGYKATFDFMADVLRQFNVVKGGDIAYWYDYERYVDGGGTLNNSCMAEVNPDYFEIYTSNPQVSLVILYDDDGEITDGKYTSKKIKGRAILWDAELNGQKEMFMDRIYTTFDSDVDLFKQFAQKNGWFYKDSQSMAPREFITNGTTTSKPEIVVKLDNVDCEYYPYCDTMCFCYTSSNELRNTQDDDDASMRVLRSTEGEWYSEI